jgi:hypothetical protein
MMSVIDVVSDEYAAMEQSKATLAAERARTAAAAVRQKCRAGNSLT